MRLPGRWTPFLLAVVAGLLITSFGLRIARLGLDLDFSGLNSLERWLLVDREMGVPAWLSTVLLFSCAVQLWQLADADRRGERRRWAPYGRLLSVAFAYLSIDELTEIHEQTLDPLHAVFDLGPALQFAWVLVALPMVLVLGLIMFRWWRSLPGGSQLAVVVCGVLYVGGAAGVEMLGSLITSQVGQDTLSYSAVSTLEEGLEMTATVLFVGTVHTLRRATAQNGPAATSSAAVAEVPQT